MVALPSMSSRGTALARTFASAFLALAEHAKVLPHEVDEIASAVAAHLKSWKPLAVTAEPTMQLVPPTDAESELVKLRAEVETMRPIYVLALAFVDAEHVRNANCSAGDHDECPAREAEIALRAAVAKHEESV